MGVRPIPIDRILTTHNHWIDAESREMWIHGMYIPESDMLDVGEPGVEYMMATTVIKNLHLLRKQSSRAAVTIHMHCCGGDWSEGMAIYDAISLMPYHVTIISYTHARSMSSIILQAADKRLMMPNSYFMFHLGDYGIEGDVRSVYSNMEFDKRTDETMLDIYVESAKEGEKFKNWEDDKIREHLNSCLEKKADVFLTAEEAVQWGFADGILEQWPRHASWTKRS